MITSPFLKHPVSHINLKLFLKRLYDRLCLNKITDEELFKITEFYIMYTHEKVLEDAEESEYLKYMIMGWYVYNNIEIS